MLGRTVGYQVEPAWSVSTSHCWETLPMICQIKRQWHWQWQWQRQSQKQRERQRHLYSNLNDQICDPCWLLIVLIQNNIGILFSRCHVFSPSWYITANAAKSFPRLWICSQKIITFSYVAKRSSRLCRFDLLPPTLMFVFSRL